MALGACFLSGHLRGGVPAGGFSNLGREGHSKFPGTLSPRRVGDMNGEAHRRVLPQRARLALIGQMAVVFQPVVDVA